MKKKRRRIFWSVLAVAILALAGWLAAARIRGPVVPVVTVEPRDLVRTIVASGRVVAADEIVVAAESFGTIVRVYVDEGDLVAAGQPVIELESESARADVKRAQASVAAARAQVHEVEQVSSDVAQAALIEAETALRQARDTHRRTETLAQAGAVSEAERDSARWALEQAESRVQSARAQARSTAEKGTARRRAQAMLQESRAALAAAEARLAKLVIRAPRDGVVLQRRAEPGDVAQPGGGLLRIATRGAPQLLIQPDEKNLADLALGQTARASADAYPAQTFAAMVTEIAPAVDPQRGTVDVTLDIPDPPPFLRPDMTVSVEVITGRKDAALAIPVAGVRGRESGEPWVLVVRERRTARQPVRLGLEGEEAVQVTAGLRKGDQVVASPQARVGPGRRVRPQPADKG